jgi:hypothetical protein
MSTIVEYGAGSVADATVADRQLAAIRWARRALCSLDVVVLDVKSVRWMHGSDVRSLCEIAIIDTAGAERLNAPFRPSLPFGGQVLGADQPLEMAEGVSSFGSIVPELLRTTAGAVVAAYNAPAVYELILCAVREVRIDPQHLEDLFNWQNISQARSDWFGQPHHYLPLRTTGHALDRCYAALHIVREIASSLPNPADQP